MSGHHPILLVDDQIEYLEVLQLILDGAGYRGLGCTSGRAALEILEQQAISLILADIAMPDMNGYQLLEAVRKRPEWVPIPFVFLSARALDSDIRYGKALGVDDYLVKPVQPEDLLAVIEGKLRRHKQLATCSGPLREAASSHLAVGPIRVDHERHRAWRGDQLLNLSAREFILLEYLVQHAGAVVPATALVRETHQLQTDDADEARELVRPLIRSLRQKLACEAGEPGTIETVRGIGYRFVEIDER